MQDREKEIKKLIYIKSEIIRKEKKELKYLKHELENMMEEKKHKRRVLK